MSKPRIVIVGAGFSGLLAAKRLARARRTLDVVLINTSDHFLFAPRLIDVLQDRFEHLPFRSDLRVLAKRHGFRFVHGTVDLVDRVAKRVRYRDADGASKELTYDIIVLAHGAATNYYSTPGAKEHTIDLKSFESIKRIRDRIVDVFERAAACKADAQCRMLLSFAVVGAGASGVEALFALKLHVEKYAATHAPKLKKFCSFILVQAAPQILPGFPQTLVDGAIAQIHRQGVSLFVGEPVVRVAADGFDTMHGRMVPAGLVLWCAGLAPHALAISPDVAKDAGGFIQTDQSLRIDTHTFAAGDAVSFRDNLVLVPKNGQTARRMAFTIVDNVLRTLDGRSLCRFHYFSKGTILIVGKVGFIDLQAFVFRSRIMVWFRDRFYRLIYNEIAT